MVHFSGVNLRILPSLDFRSYLAKTLSTTREPSILSCPHRLHPNSAVPATHTIIRYGRQI